MFLTTAVAVAALTLLCILVMKRLKETYFWKSARGEIVHGTSFKLSTPHQRFSVKDKSLRKNGMYLIRFLPSPKLMLTDPTTAIKFMAKQNTLQRLRDFRLGWIFEKLCNKAVGTAFGEDHKRIRSVWNGAYSSESVSEFIADMEQESSAFLRKMAQNKVSFGLEELTSMMFRVLMKYTYGSDLTKADMGQLWELRQLVSTLLMEGLSNPFTVLPFYKYLPTDTNRKLKELEKGWVEFNKGYTEKYQQGTLDKRSVFYKVKEKLANNPDVLSEQEFLKTLEESSITNVDIITGTIGWLLFHLAFYSDVQQKLAEEVRSKLSEVKPDGVLNSELLSRVEYAGNVIRESARVQPVVISSVPEYVACPMAIGDYTCPSGVDVSIDHVALNMDPGVWPHPETFDPQRFDNETPIMRKSLCRFGVGTRKCMGYRLADTFLKVFIVTLVRFYTVSLASDVTQDSVEVPSLDFGPFSFPNVKLKVEKK